MVFVHARNETVRTALMLAEMAKNNGHSMLFSSEKSPQFSEATKQVRSDQSSNLCITQAGELMLIPYVSTMCINMNYGFFS